MAEEAHWMEYVVVVVVLGDPVLEKLLIAVLAGAYPINVGINHRHTSFVQSFQSF